MGGDRVASFLYCLNVTLMALGAKAIEGNGSVLTTKPVMAGPFMTIATVLTLPSGGGASDIAIFEASQNYGRIDKTTNKNYQGVSDEVSRQSLKTAASGPGMFSANCCNHFPGELRAPTEKTVTL